MNLKGKYLVTDPCYIIKEEDEWDKVVDLLFPVESEINGVRDKIFTYNYKGHLVHICQTSYGDGCYPVVKNGIPVGGFGVDSGHFCVVLDSPDLYEKDLLDRQLGCLVDLDGEYAVSNGDATCGDVEILTNDWNFEEDEDEGK